MSQLPEDRLPASADADAAHSPDSSPSGSHTSQPKLAQVLPFERRSELQRAVQMRAVESIERQRARAAERPNPIRRVATFALALIPVALLFIAVDGLLRVFHHMNDLYNSPEANAAAAPAEAAPEEPSEPEPGVVLLQPPQNLHFPEAPAQPKQ
jgi:hypothetical protein